MVVIPACPESFLIYKKKSDSRQAGMTLTAYNVFIYNRINH